MASTTIGTILSGTVVTAPSSPIASKIEGAPDRRNVKVSRDDGTEEAVYYNVGTELDYLQPGDFVFLQAGRGKGWTIVVSPELSADLIRRRQKAAGLGHSFPISEPKPMNSEPRTPNYEMLKADSLAIAAAYLAIAKVKGFEEVPPDVICSLAQSAYKYWKEAR